MRKDFIDETGNKYGFLTVKEPTKDKNGRSAWLCLCDCGNTKIVRGTDLRKGKITSCGYTCPLRKNRNGTFKNEVGNRYGRLTVLYRIESDSKKVLWHCRCDCGKEKDVTGVDLRSGKVISCGCYSADLASQRNFKDEIGNRYTKLIVESLVTKHPKAIWHCKCDCGNYIDVMGIHLRNGQVKSCGCLKSQYEEKIRNILSLNNISFIKEYTFSNLVSDKGKKLRYDFGIFYKGKLKGLIEYNGEQHTLLIPSWGGQEGLEKRQYHDALKIEYAYENNIPLLILDKNNNLEKDILSFLKEIEYDKN